MGILYVVIKYGGITMFKKIGGLGTSVGKTITDDFWRRQLGVDVDAAAQLLDDDGRFREWLSRFSLTFLNLLIPQANVLHHRSKAETIDEILKAFSIGHNIERVQRAFYLSEYLSGRRRDGLDIVARIIHSDHPSLTMPQGLSEREKHLCRGLYLLEVAPDQLKRFALFDRAVRVRYEQYRLAGGEGEHISQIDQLLSGINVRWVNQHLHEIKEPGTELVCIDVVPLDVSDGTTDTRSAAADLYLFIILERGRDAIRTLDGFHHLGRSQWIVIRYADYGRQVFVHAPSGLGLRLAEGMIAKLGATSVAYRKHLPESHVNAVQSLGEAMFESRVGIRAVEIDLIVDEVPAATWQIQGDVKGAVEWLRGARRNPSQKSPSDGALLPGRFTRLSLDFPITNGDGMRRYTLWVQPGSTDHTRIVTFRGTQSDTKGHEQFLAWLESSGVKASPR